MQVVRSAVAVPRLSRATWSATGTTCCTPPYSLGPASLARMRRIALALSRRLEVVGLMNIQLAVLRPRSAMEAVYVIEENPRASLTVPFVSKACMANIPAACRDRKYTWMLRRAVLCVKEAVFALSRFPYATPSQLRCSGPRVGHVRRFF